MVMIREKRKGKKIRYFKPKLNFNVAGKNFRGDPVMTIWRHQLKNLFAISLFFFGPTVYTAIKPKK